jgi:hypothetical protein
MNSRFAVHDASPQIGALYISLLPSTPWIAATIRSPSLIFR